MIAVQVQVATDDAGFMWICKYKLYRMIQAWLCTGCPSTTSTQPCLLFSFMQKRLAVYSIQMLLHYNSCCVLYKLWNKSELNAPRSSNNMLWANVEFAYIPCSRVDPKARHNTGRTRSVHPCHLDTVWLGNTFLLKPNWSSVTLPTGRFLLDTQNVCCQHHEEIPTRDRPHYTRPPRHNKGSRITHVTHVHAWSPCAQSVHLPVFPSIKSNARQLRWTSHWQLHHWYGLSHHRS